MTYQYKIIRSSSVPLDPDRGPMTLIEHVATGQRFGPIPYDAGAMIELAPELAGACRTALRELEDWHGIEAGECPGCDTCGSSLPELRTAIRHAEGVV